MHATALGGVSVVAMLDGGQRSPAQKLRACVPTSAAAPPTCAGLALTASTRRAQRDVCLYAASAALAGGGDTGSNAHGGDAGPPRGGGGPPSSGGSGSGGFFHRSPVGLLVLMAVSAAGAGARQFVLRQRRWRFPFKPPPFPLLAASSLTRPAAVPRSPTEQSTWLGVRRSPRRGLAVGARSRLESCLPA
jgi:hypothetical protein